MFQLHLSTHNATTATTSSSSSLSSSGHEDAVQKALHVATKNHALSQSRSLKETPSHSPTEDRRVVRILGGHQCREFQRYTKEECLQVWYQNEDYSDIKNAFAFTVFMMDAGCLSKVETDADSTRGLERRTEEGQWRRFDRKRNYYNAVLDEQDRQWDNAEEDPERIAEVARACTTESSREARDFGVKDERAVYGESQLKAVLQDNSANAYDNDRTEHTASTRSTSLSDDSDIWTSSEDGSDNDDED